MIVVEETWYLSDDAAENATAVMQEVEDVIGPIAHGHSGWCGHAKFLQRIDESTRVTIVYPWRSIAEHEDLLAREASHLSPYYERYCTRPRLVTYYAELSHT
jgi:3-oxoacyl-[acyl-carrier protein] reductase